MSPDPQSDQVTPLQDAVMRAAVLKQGLALRTAEVERLKRERDQYHADLKVLMEFGKRLMKSDDDTERSIGYCICEGARRVEVRHD